MRFRLDKSRVPPDKLEDPRLAEFEIERGDMMDDERYRLRVCLHEAAHAIYLERAGALEVILHGPVVFYDQETDRFDIGDAAVQGRFPESPGIKVDALVMARWYVAGGVAKRVLTNDDDPGGEQDFEVFCDEMQRLVPGMSKQEYLEVWQQAERDVERDLRKPALRRTVWERARQLNLQLEAMFPAGV